LPQRTHDLEFDALAFIDADELMRRSRGDAGVTVGIVDGPVDTTLQVFASTRIEEIGGGRASAGNGRGSFHGTFVAGILAAERGSGTPGLCPGCRCLVRPVFDTDGTTDRPPSCSPDTAASAIFDLLAAGANVINLSIGLTSASMTSPVLFQSAIAEAIRRDALIVMAAGNQGWLGSSSLTRHPWVIPVGACDARGVPLKSCNLAPSIARQGLLAPGCTQSVVPGGGLASIQGTSVAAPFVTGIAALLRSAAPDAIAVVIRQALLGPRGGSIVPPLLNARLAFGRLGGLIRASSRAASRATSTR
jgi:subtilisin family serine protease